MSASLLGPSPETHFLPPESLEKSESVASSHKLEDRAGHRRFRQDGKLECNVSYKIRLLKKPKSNEMKNFMQMSPCPVSLTLSGRGDQAPRQASSLFLVQPQHARLACPSAPLSADEGPRERAASYPCFQDHLLTSLPTDLGTKPVRIRLDSKASTARVYGQGSPHKVKLSRSEAQDR